MSQVQDAVRIGPSELVEIEGPPEIRRRQTFAKPGPTDGQPRFRQGGMNYRVRPSVTDVPGGHLVSS